MNDCFSSDSAQMYRDLLGEANFVVTQIAKRDSMMLEKATLNLHKLDYALQVNQGKLWVLTIFLIISVIVFGFFLIRWLRKVKVQYDAYVNFRNDASTYIQQLEGKLVEIDLEFVPAATSVTTWTPYWGKRWMWKLIGIMAGFLVIALIISF